MKNSQSQSYAAAGVDITAGYKAVELMKQHIARTMTSGVCSDVGGFGGLFELDVTGMEKPVLVSGTDGVGTKLKLAFLMDKHDTVGIDCVAMCVNDIICCGAKPLFFLDYIACGKNFPEKIADIVSGIAEGCVQSGAALIGGETAEMPGFYPIDEYDLAGFSVGVVDKKNILDNKTMKEGDVIIALPSSGVHSNGFSLVRTATLKLPEKNWAAEVSAKHSFAPQRFMSSLCVPSLRKLRLRLFHTSQAAASMKTFPEVFPTASVQKSRRKMLRFFPSSTLLQKQATFPKEICSTPSIWALV